MNHERPVTNYYAFAGGIALAAVITTLVVLLGRDGDRHVVREDPAGSVERFLIAAGNGDGDTACGYLSIPDTRRVEHAAGRHVPCSEAFFDARLVVAGRNYLNNLGSLHYTTPREGDRAVVRVSGGKGSVRFTVAPVSVTAIEQQRYEPPSSNWRITSGATALVRPVP